MHTVKLTEQKIEKKTFCLLILVICIPIFLLGQEGESSLNKEEAINCYQEANRNYSKTPKVSQVYYQEVIPYFKASKLWPLYCNALVGLCTTEYILGDLGNAEKTAELTVAAVKKYLGQKNPQYIGALTNLSAFYRLKGKWEKAISIVKESIEVNESLDEINKQKISHAYHQLGTLYLELGDNEESIRYYEQAIQVWVSQNRPIYGHINHTSQALAVAYRNLENWEKSKQYYLTQIPSVDSLNNLIAYYGLGAVYAEQKMVDSARFFIQKGRKVTVNGKKPRFQEGEQLLGAISLLEKDTLQALRHYTASQNIRLKLKFTQSLINPIVNTYRIKGKLLNLQGRYVESLENIQRGISYLQNKEIDSSDWHYTPNSSDITHPWEAIKILETKAKSLYELFKKSSDISHLNIAHESVKLGAELIPKIQNLHASEGGKLGLSESARPLIELGIEITQRLYELSNDPTYLWDGFGFAEQIKSRFLIEELLETEAISQSNFPKDLKDELQSIEADIGFYTKRIQDIPSKNGKDSSKVIKWKKQLFELNSQQNELIKKLEEKYPLFGKRNLKLPKPGEEILEKILGKEAKLLEFFWAKEYLYLFSISKGRIQLFTYELNDELLLQIETTASILRNPSMAFSEFKNFSQASYKLYKTLLSSALGDTPPSTLFLVLDGPLSYIPFEVLLTNNIKQLGDDSDLVILSQAYRKLPYLFKSTNIHYLHASSLIQWNSFVRNNRLEKLATFAPNYEGNLQLRNNKNSAQKITKILGGNTYLNYEASESNFKSKSRNYEAIHLAVHGNADVTKPINSYLDFGISDSTQDDNRLYAYELYALALNAKLVSLIACEAGFGKLEKGEGVMSLARAFRMAGANSIMTSLWKADGRAASPIAEKFYEHLKEGKRPSEALRSSKIEFLQTASPDLTHPYYWATYVLTGNNDAIWPNYLNLYGGWISLGVLLLLIGLLYRRLSKKIKLS